LTASAPQISAGRTEANFGKISATRCASLIVVALLVAHEERDSTMWAILNDQVATAVQEAMTSKSDRVLAVVGGAIVEEALLRALELRLRKSKVQEMLFKPTGALGGFANKIELGYLLHMYEKSVRSALIGVSEIRNVFAHQLQIDSLDQPVKRLTEGLNKLQLHTEYKWYPSPLWAGNSTYRVGRPSKCRTKFITNMKIILLLLMRDMRVHGHRNNIPMTLPQFPLIGARSRHVV
jgi:hypothetical protein